MISPIKPFEFRKRIQHSIKQYLICGKVLTEFVSFPYSVTNSTHLNLIKYIFISLIISLKHLSLLALQQLYLYMNDDCR